MTNEVRATTHRMRLLVAALHASLGALDADAGTPPSAPARASAACEACESPPGALDHVGRTDCVGLGARLSLALARGASGVGAGADADAAPERAALAGSGGGGSDDARASAAASADGASRDGAVLAEGRGSALYVAIGGLLLAGCFCGGPAPPLAPLDWRPAKNAPAHSNAVMAGHGGARIPQVRVRATPRGAPTRRASEGALSGHRGLRMTWQKRVCKTEQERGRRSQCQASVNTLTGCISSSGHSSLRNSA